MHTQSPELGIEVALWHLDQPNINACKECNEGLVEDEYHLHTSAVHESCDDILRVGDD